MGESLDQAVEVVVTVEILVIRGGPAQSIADPVMGIGNAVYSSLAAVWMRPVSLPAWS